ncbi:MAG: hypothetical protein AAGA57_07180 [Planctomycetota bacterium]
MRRRVRVMKGLSAAVCMGALLAPGGVAGAQAATPEASPVRMPGPELIQPDGARPGFEAGGRPNPSEISRAINDSRGDIPLETEWLISAAGLGLMAFAAVSWARWMRSRARRGASSRLAWKIAKAGGLTSWDRVVLWRVAVNRRLPSMTPLLISPATLRLHGRAYAEALPEWAAGSVMQRIEDAATVLERPWSGPARTPDLG